MAGWGDGIRRDGCGYVDGGMTGDSRLRGNDVEEGVGMTCPPFKSHTRLTNAIRTGRLSIGFACDTLRCIHRSLGFG